MHDATAQTTDPTASVREALASRLAAGKLALPPLPEVAQRVLALVGDEKSSAAELADLVHRDAGLASAVLRRANSAALESATRIVSLQQAVARLGIRAVAEIAVSVSIRNDIFAAPRYASLVEEAWRRSLGTALYAKEVARALRRNVEVAFLCGLLWRVGRPLVWHALPQVCPPKQLPDEAEASALGEALGDDFGATGVQAWRLPDTVAAAVAVRLGGASAPAESHVAALAEELTDAALAEEAAETALAFRSNGSAEALNLYPEDVTLLRAKADAIRTELGATS